MTRLPLRFALSLTNLVVMINFITTAHAVDFTVYTDKSAFLAALSPGYYTETFNTLAVNTLLSSPIVLNSGPNQFQVSTGSGDFYTPANGSDVWLSTDDRSASVNFSAFANNPTAIGGYFFLTNSIGSPNTGTIIHQFHRFCFHQQYSTLIAVVDHIGHHLVGHSQRRNCRECLASP